MCTFFFFAEGHRPYVLSKPSDYNTPLTQTRKNKTALEEHFVFHVQIKLMARRRLRRFSSKPAKPCFFRRTGSHQLQPSKRTSNTGSETKPKNGRRRQSPPATSNVRKATPEHTPQPPRQSRSTQHRGGDRDGGQKLHGTSAASTEATTPGDTHLTG